MIAVIIIPCFREQHRLPTFLRDLAQHLSTSPHLRGTILVVDDGSGPAEAVALLAAVSPIQAEFPHLIQAPLLLPANLGKGGAVYHGWAQACTEPVDLLGFIDADGSTSAKEFCRLWSILLENTATVDAVLGSRIRMLGREVERPLKRHLLGRVFATLTHWATGVKVYDSQCGAKMFKASVYQTIRHQLQETGFAFDVELIRAAIQHRFRLIEVPVDWQDEPGSQVRLFRDSFRMFRSLLRIRRRNASISPSNPI